MQSQSEFIRYIAGAIAFRIFLLLIKPFTNELLNRIEFSNAFVGYLHVKEAAFLISNGVHIYDASRYLPNPIIVGIASHLHNRITEAIFFISIDLTAAYYLYKLETFLLILPFSFLCNPMAVLSCASKTFASVNILCLIMCIYHGIAGDHAISMILLAFSSFISVSPLAILPPMLSLHAKLSTKLLKLFIFAAFFLILLGVSLLTTGSWSFIQTSIIDKCKFGSLRPNIGIYWYLFIEIFEFFRPLFAGFLFLHSLFYGLPISIYFKKDPLFMLTISTSIMLLFQPYPTITDHSFLFTLLLLHPNLIDKMRFFGRPSLLLIFCAFMGPTMWHMWIDRGSGNANFFYAICVLWNVVMMLIIMDMIKAWLRLKVEALNPEKDPELLYQ